MIRFQAAWPVVALSVFVPALSSCESRFFSEFGSNTAAQPAVAQTQPPVASPPPPPNASGRDPFMERGAQFMTVVMESKRRLEKNPDDKESLLFLGNANYDISRFEQAKDYYTRYLDLDPKHAGVRTDLATSYYQMKDVDSAVRELKAVLAQAPDHEAALFNLGLILARDKQDRPGAIAAWERLLLTHPTHPKAAEVRQQIEALRKKS